MPIATQFLSIVFRLTFYFRTHVYAVMDESHMAQQQCRPTPQIGAVRPEQPERQNIQPRIEMVSTTDAERQPLDARRRANSERDTSLTRNTAVEVFKPKKNDRLLGHP